MAAGAGIYTASADEYWDQKTSLFEVLPITGRDIVFLGNSITDGGEFNELFEMDCIKNRGIRSDLITGVEKRLGQITPGHPDKIFLLIGINDVSHGHSVAELAKRYERLVKRIRTESPDTKLYLQSVMPINNSFKRYKGLIGKESTIREFNKEIEKIAAANGAEYVNLWPFLADSNGRLKADMTNDGLHLNGRGYRAWASGIQDLVKK
ncbi:MAG: GDSL family lipase [Muribaculaceae bacterium]|nr:GDSL family lipase [Muribaculaceae bacterium]